MAASRALAAADMCRPGFWLAAACPRIAAMRLATPARILASPFALSRLRFGFADTLASPRNLAHRARAAAAMRARPAALIFLRLDGSPAPS